MLSTIVRGFSRSPWSLGLCGLSVPSVPLLSSVPPASSLSRCKYTTFEPLLSSILTIIFSTLFRKMGLPTPTRLSQKTQKHKNTKTQGVGVCVISCDKVGVPRYTICRKREPESIYYISIVCKGLKKNRNFVPIIDYSLKPI